MISIYRNNPSQFFIFVRDSLYSSLWAVWGSAPNTDVYIGGKGDISTLPDIYIEGNGGHTCKDVSRNAILHNY